MTSHFMKIRIYEVSSCTLILETFCINDGFGISNMKDVYDVTLIHCK